jgi:hypothetical protein
LSGPFQRGWISAESIANSIFILHTLAQYAATGEGDAKPLKGTKEFRLRVEDWRVLFEQSPEGAIRILHVKHRREAYR